MHRKGLATALAASLLLAAPMAAADEKSSKSDPVGGRIVLDQPVKAAGLQLFPVVGEPDVYLYAPMTPRLAVDDQGRPQFSFLRFVDNEGPKGDGETPDEGAGGGILHAVVSLDVPESQLERARGELQRLRPGAEIEGAAIYSRGTLALVSTFQADNGDLVRQLVGLANAPLLEGAKAAVSMELTKEGAQILWESFHMPTPDIGFRFDMALPGYWSPAQGRVVADLDEVTRHETFQFAVANPVFSAEIDKAFDELHESKAIQVITIGDVGQDDKASMFSKAEQQIRDELFEADTGAKAAKAAKSAKDATSKDKKPDTDALMQRAQAIHKENATIRQKQKKAEVTQAEAERLDAIADEKEATAEGLAERYAEAQREGAEREGELAGLEKEAKQLETGKKQQDQAVTQAADALKKAQDAKEKDADRIAELEAELETAKETQAEAQGALDEAERDAAALKKELSGGPKLADLKSAVEKAEAEAKQARAKAEAAAKEARDAALADSEEEQSERVGYMAYRLRESHKTGRYEFDMRRHTNGELPMRFDGNIGDVSRYLDDPDFFRQANLDDPMYKQREIEVYVDGMNARDFGKFVNFVSVQLRKQHQNGDVTLDEVRIDRRNFDAEGNRFRMLYGWKGDDDRDQWLEYEWRAVWSFFGGHDVEEPWQTSVASGIRAFPPYEIREVSLEADPENMEEVRSTTVRLYYELAGEEQMEQVTLRMKDPTAFSTPVQLLFPEGEYEYGYDVSWRLRGNRSLSVPRSTTSSAILYIDELPEEAAEVSRAE